MLLFVSIEFNFKCQTWNLKSTCKWYTSKIWDWTILSWGWRGRHSMGGGFDLFQMILLQRFFLMNSINTDQAKKWKWAQHFLNYCLKVCCNSNSSLDMKTQNLITSYSVVSYDSVYLLLLFFRCFFLSDPPCLCQKLLFVNSFERLVLRMVAHHPCPWLPVGTE